MRRLDDWEAGSFLKNLAMLEIRAMARRRKAVELWSDDDYVACIAWLADVCHNMPDASLRGVGFHGMVQRFIGRERPFSHAWATVDPLGRKWITDRLAREGIEWVPPAASQRKRGA